ncbi:uncharacterized protein LOC141807600 [Halichoeres trimaculatus]|uniref:uncharacterized protein LOC141807600 n=1 Tax=Halichoeres trimaculatus TaxID=147232 RepID=UPI003D9F28DB
MVSMKQLVFLVFLSFPLQPCAGEGENKLDCNFNESCTLLCRFKTGEHLLIRWKVNETKEVIFYHNDKVDFKNQAEHFRGRASGLEEKDLSNGDALLRLALLKVQDEGRYTCYISVSTMSAQTCNVELRVNAFPGRVNMQREGNKISCSAEGIHPRPDLTWSSPPSSTLNSTEEPRVLQTEQQLYSISSVMELVDESVDYSCTVSTRKNKRKATLLRPTSLNGSSTETKILCNQNTPHAPQTGLTWRFNHSQIILRQTTAGAPREYSGKWKEHVKTTSETRDLILENLSSDHDGVYTCELSTAEEDYITNTELKVITDSSHKTGAIVGGVLAALVLLIPGSVGAFYLWRYYKQRDNDQQAPNNGPY